MRCKLNQNVNFAVYPQEEEKAELCRQSGLTFKSKPLTHAAHYHAACSPSPSSTTPATAILNPLARGTSVFVGAWVAPRKAPHVAVMHNAMDRPGLGSRPGQPSH